MCMGGHVGVHVYGGGHVGVHVYGGTCGCTCVWRDPCVHMGGMCMCVCV